MATMVPATVHPRTPPGEVTVFEALRDHPGTDGWLVFHGLRIRHHETQVEGEADFVVVVPGEGMLVVEVKSHDRVEIDDDGRWRLGSQEPSRRSPYDQAWDNSRSIAKWIERRAYLAPYPIWQAVWFPSIGGEIKARLEARIDVTPNATLTRADLDASRMVTSIVGVLRHGRSELERRMPQFFGDRPDAQDIAEVRQVLVPSITWARAMAERRQDRERDLREATERQEQALQYFSAHPRLLVTGPAGTGKTNVAVRAAQQAANRDERVLLTCFNELLEADLQHRLRTRGEVTVARVHQLMLAYSDLTPPDVAGDDWWNGALPAAALAVTRAPGFEPPFTALVADEAQDLARDTTLDVLDSLLLGGLAGARVVLAGDFTHQDIYRPREPLPVVAPPVAEGGVAGRSRLATIQRRLPDAARMTLTANARQTPKLADLVEQLITGVFYTDYLRDEEDEELAGEVRLYRTRDEQDALLQQALETLWADGWDPHEILILSPRRDSAARRAFGAVADASPHQGAPAGIRWGTVHRYKGLEAPVVVLTDVDGSTPNWEDLLYVGMTRATERLVVLTSIEELAERA